MNRGLLFFVLVLLGCNKDKEDANRMSADIDGVHWMTSGLGLHYVDGTRQLLFFDGGNADATIGIRVASLPSRAPGNYSFREANLLPANLLSFSGSMVNSFPVLSWSTGSEISLSSFRIERSGDGTNFREVGSVPATNSGSLHQYTFTDTSNHTAERFYYRLKMQEVGPTATYSSVILMNLETAYTAFWTHGPSKFSRGYNGTIQIATHDSAARHITGTFSFDAATESGIVHHIRNGQFDVHY